MTYRKSLRDQGSISALVVCTVSIFVACAGLVLDGGRLVAARTRGAAIAEEAARDGAQEVHRLREGRTDIDVNLAEVRARDYLRRIGTGGTVHATAHMVTVTVSVQVRPLILGLFGVGARTVTVTRTARPVDR